jgi:hypothetical protein
MKLGIRVFFYKNLLSRRNFHEKRSSDAYTLRSGEIEFLTTVGLSVLFDGCG